MEESSMEEWRQVAPAFARSGPCNRRFWRHAASGRSRTMWAEFVAHLSDGTWSLAVGGSLPCCATFVARGLAWDGLPTTTPPRPPQLVQPLADSLPPLPRVSAFAERGDARVQMFTDAQLLANAAGAASSVPAVASEILRSALAQLWWVCVHLNAEWNAEWSVYCARSMQLPSTGQHAQPLLATPRGLTPFLPQRLARRCWPSPAARPLSQAQGWGAFLAACFEGSWTIVVARTWRGPPTAATVPVLEARELEAAAQL